MTLQTVKRLAADILGVGENKIRFKTEDLKEIEKAMMRKDVRDLIMKGSISALPKKGRKKKKPKRRRGRGSRKGSLGDSKKRWMRKVRSQRELLATLVRMEALPKEHKRRIYLKVKGGMFRNKRAMLLYLTENELIPKDFKLPKPERKKPAEKKPVAKKPEKTEEKKEVEKK